MSSITTRFQNIYRLQDHCFEIIGCGAIGSYTAMNLVRAGATKFMLWDPDVVDAVNIGVQHYDLTHIGNSKVKMLRKQMLDINPLADISIKRQKYDNCYWSSNFYYSGFHNNWESFRSKKTFVICGVDSMDARKTIVENFINKYKSTSVYYVSDTYFIDARMGSETFQMYQWQIMNDETTKEFLELKNQFEENWYEETNRSITLTPSNVFNRGNGTMRNFMQEVLQKFNCEYGETWYYDEDGDSEPCNARSTNYCASMAGSFINNQIRKLVDPSSPSNTNLVFNFPSMMVKCDTNYNLTQ